MNVFRGMTIMLLTIIAYMLLDGLLNIPFITYMLAAISGVLIIFTCKTMDRSELNMFRASLVMGVVFFVIGNFIILSEKDKYYINYDPFILYIVTMGFFLSAIGMIIMFSSIPIIIYKDLEEHRLRSG